MDTIPFHCLMFAADVVLWIVLLYWIRPKQKQSEPQQSDTKYIRPKTFVAYSSSHRIGKPFMPDYSQPYQPDIPQKNSFFSYISALSGVAVLGFFGLFSIALFAYLFRTNFGQCAVEGLTYHGSVFLFIAGVLLLRRQNYITAVFLFLCSSGIFAAGFDMLVIEPYYSLKVEYYTLTSPKIKKPLRLVFAADIQTDRIGWYERKTLQIIQEQNADLIIFGGDYLQYYPGTRGVEGLEDRFRRLFKDVPLTAPLGVFAICGNLDPAHHQAFGELFKDTGVEAVYDSTIIENLGIDKDRGPIDLTFLSMIDSIGGVGESGLTETGNFLVMAGHYPNYAIKDYQKTEKRPDLMFAGHTHGGQVALPFYGPLRVKYTGRDKIITNEFLRGIKNFDNGSKLIISRGTGMERGWAPRVRFFCRPEISVVDLQGE